MLVNIYTLLFFNDIALIHKGHPVLTCLIIPSLSAVLDLMHLTGLLLDMSVLTVKIEFDKMTNPKRERTTAPKKKAVEPSYAKSDATELYKGLELKLQHIGALV
ncbi:hypothetical protein DZC72_03225 [Maribacter algicola]|uniref:Uncharacterized protein n=2 Tax=Maribacter algicola TaxID=2498892 RepID=A0A3R8R103_9FLAO|nr:hypothetical protein DZC72_03225 [Maribacter algicola]